MGSGVGATSLPHAGAVRLHAATVAPYIYRLFVTDCGDSPHWRCHNAHWLVFCALLC